jgi:hypothetical protein
MDRRHFLVGALSAAAAAVTVRFAMAPASAAPATPQPEVPRPQDMAHRTAEGWESHLLPFAGPFPSLSRLEAELRRSRAVGLFR